jgi:pimeloyl-ACP methyl ester carboxylesterase
VLLWSGPFRPTNAFSSTSPSQNNHDVATTKDEQIVLPNGVKAQVISSFPPNYSYHSSSPLQNKPPILFLHGSFHGAWCWQEHYLPYFVEKGYPCVAFSWRGTGGTPAGEGVTKVKIVQDHCDDFHALLETLPSILGKSESDDNINVNVKKNHNENRLLPIVVSHSMGGIIVMKYLDELYSKQPTTKPNQVFSGIVSMCSVPPSGNSKTTMRYLRRSLLDTYKITVGFVLKKVISDDTICRECFFGGTMDDFGVSDEDLARYQRYMERDSIATLDVGDLGKRAPSKTAGKWFRFQCVRESWFFFSSFVLCTFVTIANF